MFKADWEKASTRHKLPEGVVDQMLHLAYPGSKIASIELMTGGCANLNYKIQLTNEKQPLVLRVYLNDKTTAYKEQQIAVLIKGTVPIPAIHFIGEFKRYHFAIMEFIPGITLRDLLLNDDLFDLSAIMHEIGWVLAKIIAYQFPKAGFLGKDLRGVPSKFYDVMNLAQDCLSDKTVAAVLGSLMVAEIQTIIGQYSYLLPKNQKHLVHGDFNPSNILVDKVNDSWIVTGVLDWEFAFSGSYLWDVAHVLRYAYKMPSDFQRSFIDSLRYNHIELPADCTITINILNLFSLLEILKRSVAQNKPRACADIRELIGVIVVKMRNIL